MSTETAPSFRSASRGDLRPVFYITAAHLALDFYMVLTPPLWAFFQSHYNLTVAQFAYLPTVIVFCGSITQPFMGYFSDGRDRMALVALGLFVTGIFVSCIGFAPTAYTLAIFLIFASFGSSLFHPTAGGLVTALTPQRANLSMAIFLTGGTTGMALASITGTQIVERYGIQYLWLIVIPVLILAPFILWQSRKVPVRERRVTAGKIDFSILKKARSLWTLLRLVCCALLFTRDLSVLQLFWERLAAGLPAKLVGFFPAICFPVRWGASQVVIWQIACLSASFWLFRVLRPQFFTLVFV